MYDIRSVLSLNYHSYDMEHVSLIFIFVMILSNIVILWFFFMKIDHTRTRYRLSLQNTLTIKINDLKMKTMKMILYMLDACSFYVQRMQTNFMHVIIIKNTCFSSLSLSMSFLLLVIKINFGYSQQRRHFQHR